MRQIVQIRKGDDSAGSIRKFTKCVGDEHLVAHRIDLGLRGQFDGVLVGSAIAVTLLGADVVDDAVAGDAHQPCAETALLGVVSLPPPGAQEHLLGDVLGAFGIEGTGAEAVHQAAELVVGKSKRVLVSAHEAVSTSCPTGTSAVPHCERSENETRCRQLR